MSSTCEPELLPNLSLDKWNWVYGVQTITEYKYSSPKRSMPWFSQWFVFQTDHWQAQPPITKATHTILYGSSVQHVFKYRFWFVVYAFTNEKKETWRFLAKLETGNRSEFSLHSYSVPVDFYSRIANVAAQGGFETTVILQGKIVRNGT